MKANFFFLWTAKNIWKSYIWTADKDVNESDPRSHLHYLSSSENKAGKKFRPVRDGSIKPRESFMSSCFSLLSAAAFSTHPWYSPKIKKFVCLS